MRDRSIGEMAEQCGLSIRSLRHLEQMGLVHPRRTEAGRRVYGTGDVALITRIMLLKRTGYRLSEISAAMLEPSLDSRSLVETQILHLSAKQKQIDAMLLRLKHTLDLLETRDAPDVDGLCSLITEAQKIMTQNEFKDIAKEYFTEDEWARWQTLGNEMFPGEARTRYEQDWSSLIARVEDAIGRDVNHSSAEAQALLSEWMMLQAPMVEALGKEHWNKAATMYAEMETWQTETARPPFSAAVYAFMSETKRNMSEATASHDK